MLMKLASTAKRAARRFASSLPALFGVLVFTFLLMRVLPGDPAVFFASGPNSGKEEIEAIRKQMGLDKPVPQQLVLYLYDVGRGNLGRSLMTGQAVTKDLKERLPASLEFLFRECELIVRDTARTRGFLMRHDGLYRGGLIVIIRLAEWS